MKYLLLAVLTSCTVSNETIKKVADITTSINPTAPAQERKVPSYLLPSKITAERKAHYDRAIALIKQFANSEEFYQFTQAKRKYFSHFTGTTVEAYAKFRDCLDRGQEIKITFYRPMFPSSALGGWNGVVIDQNTRKIMTDIERAGHLLHETSHVCEFRHNGNYPDKYDNRNSFPYAIGYDFEDFLSARETKLAGESK